MPIRIETSDNSTAKIIEQELLKTLRQNLEQTSNENIVLAARTEVDILIGGLTASTAYGWLLIKTLWVGEKQQRKGLGTTLMDHAESKGRDLGCHSAWLDTSNPSAKLFYEALGYEVFGELKNNSTQMPTTHQRWFMKKTLF